MNVFVSYHPSEKHTLSYLSFISHEIFKIYKDNFTKNEINIYDIPVEFNKEKIFNDKNDYYDFFLDFTKKNLNLKENNYFFGYSPIGFDILFKKEFEKLINDKCFRICWIDDLHAFYKRKTDIFNLEQDFNKEELKDYRLEKTDIILTPSPIFFKNCKINYIDKCVFFFYAINPNDNYFKKIKPYNERKNKILLSGCISKKTYPSRNFILKKISKKDYYIKEYFEILEHPGYVNTGHCDHSKTWYNYYDIIQDYKMAFVGIAKKPLNFLLAKIIEIMSVGTLALIEESPLLKKELGLIKDVHYVSVKYTHKLSLNENIINKIIEDKDGKYRNIAENGRKYVLNEINLNKNYKKIKELIKFKKKI